MAPRLRLLDAQGSQLSDSGESAHIALELGPREDRQLQVVVEIDRDIPRGQSAAIEAELVSRAEQPAVVGSLGMVLLAPSET
jgi:hypothetical protein